MNNPNAMKTDQELLDHFAAAALTGLLANFGERSANNTAEMAYYYAKAMLEERRKYLTTPLPCVEVKE